MIVECTHCRTRFQLDDGRVPASGVQVRCSRCKHAFFLKPPAETPSDEPTQRTPADAAPQAARDPAAEDAPPAARKAASPSAAETPGAELFDFGAAANPDHAVAEEESDWEFNTDFPQEEEAAAAPVRPDTAADGPAQDADSFSLDDLGSPEDWNLIDEGAEESLEATRTPVAAADPVSAPAPQPRAATREPTPSPAPVAVRPPASGPPLLGWGATALMLLLVAHGGLRVSAQRSDSMPGGTQVAGLVAEDLRSRRVENVWGPTLYVVSGRLRNPDAGVRAPGALIAVQLARASGAPIPGLRAPAGSALAPDVLREAPPERIRDRQHRSARRIAKLAIAPGESIRFDAVFEALPSDAALVELESIAWTEPEPVEPEPAPLAAEPEADALESPATTSSSPPAAPPSSE